MIYQTILDALKQELACVTRTITLLTKANTGKEIAAEGRHAYPASSIDEKVERAVRASAKARIARRQPLLAELHEERMLIAHAMEVIQKLARRR